MFARNILRLRFSLKTLLAAPLLICAFLAWWQMPFTISQSHSNGSYVRTVVRRGWDGVLYRHGARIHYYNNGRKQLEFVEFGLRYKSYCVNTPPGARCWDPEGREISYPELLRQTYKR